MGRTSNGLGDVGDGALHQSPDTAAGFLRKRRRRRRSGGDLGAAVLACDVLLDVDDLWEEGGWVGGWVGGFLHGRRGRRRSGVDLGAVLACDVLLGTI